MDNISPLHLPWELVVKDDKYGKELLIVGAGNSEEVPVICGTFFDSDYAEYITLCCNNFEAVVECLREVYRKPGSYSGEKIHNLLAKIESERGGK